MIVFGTLVTRIVRIDTDVFCENPYHPRHLRFFIFKHIVVLLLLAGGFSCSVKENPPVEEIILLSTDPEENSVVGIEIETITFVFNKNVFMVDSKKIALNGVSVLSSATSGKTLTVKTGSLQVDTKYEIIIEKNAIRDDAYHLNHQSFSLQFSTNEEIVIPSAIIRLEAENAVLSGGGSNPALIVNDPLCSGGKYVDTRDGNLKFSFTVSEAGNYKVIANVRASHGDKVNKFRFDGDHTIDVSFHRNNAFEEFVIVDPYYYAAGNHTIEMLSSWGWIQFDYLEISPSSAVPVEFDIQPLVTPQPAESAAKLYQFMLDNFQQRIISGVMTAKGLSVTAGNEQNEIVWVHEKTGKKPAMIGLDFLDHTGIPWVNNPDVVQDAITWRNSNGIVSFCWHWRDPSRTTWEFYTDRTNFDPRKIFEDQSAEYAAMMSDMDIIAGYLKELQDNDVPVLWRPLHEASGGWFWWGAQGPEACRKIWQIMFDKFTNEHGLKNLIWVWTSEANSATLNWYPGDEYVDIIGLDIYDEGNHGSQMLVFEELKRLYNGKKMLAISECGSIPHMEAMKKDQAIWSYYMPWNGEMTKNARWNSVNDWILSLSDPDVITLDDLSGSNNLQQTLSESKPMIK